MHVRHKGGIALGATVLVMLAAWIGTSAGGAASGEPSAKEHALASNVEEIGTSAGGAASGETTAKQDALPSNLEKMIANPESATAEYELQAARTRHVDLQSAAGDIWVIPGSSGGACLFQADGAGSCANADEIANGRLVLGILPPPSAGTSSSPTFIGYAPATAATIKFVDGEGDVVAEVTPQEDTRIYAFRLARQPGASVPLEMVVANASGKALATLPLGGGAP